MRNHRCTVVLAVMLASTTVSAQELRPESLQLYGGTYTTNCRDAAAPSVKIGAAGLVVSQGARSMRTPARMDSYTSFGGAPTSVVPEGYRVEFIGDDFSIYVFEDGKGLHVPLEGYVAAEKVVGKDAMKQRLGRCPK